LREREAIRAGLAGDGAPALAYLARFGPPGWKLTQSDSDASVTAGAGVTAHQSSRAGLPRVNHFEDEGAIRWAKTTRSLRIR
jgi:hypothetical protein